MKHLGDITKISGYETPVVDTVIGGSPCQDLSVAGKGKGLAGERSGLFMDQIRIVKEMRERDRNSGRAGEFIRPRYMVWENVPGAFSSNKGKDFRVVLEEIIKIVEPEANVPMPEKNKWSYSGILLGDGWSVAWRVLDAQFWGTSDKPLPQRRRRIALVADFGGQSAPEILFVRKSVSGNSEPGEPKREKIAGDVGKGFNGAVGCDVYNFQISGDKAVTLTANTGLSAGSTGPTVAVPYTLKIRSGCEGGGKGALIQKNKSATLSTLQDQTLFQPIFAADQDGVGGAGKAVGFPLGFRPENVRCYEETATTLCNGTRPGFTTGVIQPVAYSIENHPADSRVDIDEIAGVDCRNGVEYPELNGTVQAKSGGGFSLNCNQVVRTGHVVRRLTPLECERLQGFPDGWTDIGEWVDSKGKKHKEADSPRYKALGNSIALPPWKWVLKRLCACYERDATMASLFDGIGGFPYIWEQLNGKGSCLWASEIEEFPMAVTKRRFGEE